MPRAACPTDTLATKPLVCYQTSPMKATGALAVLGSTVGALGLVGASLLLVACEEEEFSKSKTLGGKQVSAETLNAGKEAYTHYCRACHGDKGDGHGPAAHRNGVVPAQEAVMSQPAWYVEPDQPDSGAEVGSAPALVTLHYLSGALRRRWAVCVASAVLGALIGVFASVLLPAPASGTVTLMLSHEPGTDPAIGSFRQSFAPDDPIGAFPLVVVVDDSEFAARSERNFLWVTFTRSNPAADVDGVGAFVHQKHWGCAGPLVIDARIKPHHAPPLVDDPEIERRVDALGEPGGPLHGII